jgi:gliding motility-associated-like protein
MRKNFNIRLFTLSAIILLLGAIAFARVAGVVYKKNTALAKRVLPPKELSSTKIHHKPIPKKTTSFGTIIWQDYNSIDILYTGQPVTLADYTANPQVTNNGGGPLVITQLPLPGTSLPIDEPVWVTLTANDGNGNTASTGFYVTLANPHGSEIVPKANIVLTLDAQTGKYTLKPEDVATYFGNTEPPAIADNVLDCSRLGQQMVKVSARQVINPDGIFRIAADKKGNVYMQDNGFNRVLKITPGGTASVLVGNGSTDLVTGKGQQASFGRLYGIAVNAAGEVFLADRTHSSILKVLPNGELSVYLAGAGGDFIAFDKQDNLIAITNQSVFKISPTGQYTQLTNMYFGEPTSLTFDNVGNIYLVDRQNGYVYKISTTGVTTLVAGGVNAGAITSLDGIGADARFNVPTGITMDIDGNFLVTETYGSSIRKVTPAGAVTTVSETTPGHQDGPLSNSRFDFPNLSAGDGHFFSYVVDGLDKFLRKISPSEHVTTIDPVIDITTTKFIPVTVVTKPVFEAYADATINSLCPTTLPNYTTNARVSTACPGVHLTVTQSPAAGTPMQAGVPVPVTLTAKDDFGGSGTVTFNSIWQNSLANPSVQISPASVSTCPTMPVHFLATVTDGGANPAYQWTLNGVNLNEHGQVFAIQTLKTGDKVTCIVTNTDPCTNYPPAVSNTPNIYVEDLSNTLTSFNKSFTGSICAGDAATYTIETHRPATFQWQVNHVNVNTTSNSFTSTTLNNGDIVGCVINFNNVCLPLDHFEEAITVFTKPTISFSPSSSVTLKIGETIRPNSSSGGDVIGYYWSPATGVSDVNEQFPVISPTSTTTYTLTVLGESGCNTSATLKIHVENPIIAPNTFTPNGDGINDTWSIPALTAYPDNTVTIYNRYGALVFQSNGYAKAWDGTAGGKNLPAGVYYYIIAPKTIPTISGNITILR